MEGQTSHGEPTLTREELIQYMAEMAEKSRKGQEEFQRRMRIVDIPPGTSFNDPLPEEHSPNLTRLLEDQKRLELLVASDITVSPPVLQQAGNAVIYPNTINVIQGQAGVHKSRLAELICAAMLKRQDCHNELLSFKRTAPDAAYTVVYVDSERNLKEQLPIAVQNIMIKAGNEKSAASPNFKYVTMLRIPRRDRFDTLNEYLTLLRKTNSQPLFIVLDVSTDCIDDFNKVDTSLGLIDLMNITINDHDAIVLCVIHENPKSDKARGHFGTELMNKASTVMQVGFEKDANNADTDLVRARYLKCRGNAKHAPFHFKYNDEAKGLVLASANDVADVVNQRIQKAGIADIIEHIETYLGSGNAVKRNDLLAMLCHDFNASERTMEIRLKHLHDTREEFYGSEGQICTLHKETRDKQIFYSLKQVEN